jgi:superfamily I DNA and/or RNA helicase
MAKQQYNDKPNWKQKNNVPKDKGNLLQNIWQLHTDVQEQMLRLRSVPVRVLPESAKIVGEKLYLTADENEKSNKIVEEVASAFKIDTNEINTDKGFFFSDTTVDIETKRTLSERAKVNFINFQPLAIIDGFIKAKGDTKYFQVSIAPNPTYFLKTQFPEYSFIHKTLFVKEHNKRLQYSTRILTEKSIDDELFKVLEDAIGLRKDHRFHNSYTYDFFKYINLLTANSDGLFTYDKEEFLKQFQDNCKQQLLQSDNNIVFPIEQSTKVEDTICDILKNNTNIYCSDFTYVKGKAIFEEVEISLREKFPSIQTKRDDKNGILYFFQEYQTQEQGYRLRQVIESEINTFDTNAFEVGLYPIPDGKDKYILEIDTQSKRESQTTAVKELRGADFCVGKNTFGKLFRVNYPQLIFDISGDDFDKTKQLFESHIVNSIEPNLTGDLEKINRLKSSLNNILQGTNLQNKNLKEFIFDAEKAKKIENIEYHINPLSETFQELESHLLNNKVNESQKQAIIKTLLAEDLALIQGPPGTGKSTAIAEMIWQHIRRNPREKILLTSETNLAVDNAIDRIVNRNHNLVKPIRIGGEEKLEMEGRQFSLDVMKRWVENGTVEIDEENQSEEETLPQKMILQNWIDNIKRRINKEGLDEDICSLWDSMLSNPSKKIRQLFYENYIKNCNVIGATCSSMGKYNQNLSDMFSTDRKRVNIPTQFYKQYCEVFGTKNSYTNKEGEQKTKHSDAELKFTTVIQDESSKATPAELSLPLIYGKKNIIIGDHRQLPPLLDKEEFKMSLDFLLDRTEKDEERQKIKELKSFVLKHFNEMEISHFERLFEKIDDSLKGVFNLQYRMHPDINDVIKQFYVQDNGLECGLITPIDLGVNNPDMNHWASRYHGIEIDGLISKDTHTIWIDTNSPELLDGTSRTNYGEVEAIREVLTKLRNSDRFKHYQSFWTNPEDQQIGLISFYGKQIKLLQNLRNEFRDIPIRVSTVDRFQGMERNIIIVSMVRSNRIAADKKQKADTNLYGALGFPEQKDLGFAQSPNRLNVALSRAKRLLIIVGNSELFRQKPIYDNVYKTIADNPNSAIIKRTSFDYTYKLETPTINLNKSLNLNTRDIDTKRDTHLRNKETWLTERKDNPKIAVLELSTKAVKLLIADQNRLTTEGFSFECFLRDTQKTETGMGLDGRNKMNMNYFNSRVMPAISKRVKIIKQNKVDVVYCVATAAYRTASNRDEIVDAIQKATKINVNILSKQEEAEATFWAYTFSTTNKDNFLKAQNVIMIDQGGGSTEITIFQNQKLVKSHSLEIGTTVLKNIFFQNNSLSIEDALIETDKQSTSKIKELLSTFDSNLSSDIYCVCVGTAITEATTGKKNKQKHDKVLTKEFIERAIDHYNAKIVNENQDVIRLQNQISRDNDYERVVVSRLGLPVILEIMDYFGINSIRVNGTGLWYGIFFQELYKIK